jgi:hypothetical protein
VPPQGQTLTHHSAMKLSVTTAGAALAPNTLAAALRGGQRGRTSGVGAKRAASAVRRACVRQATTPARVRCAAARPAPRMWLRAIPGSPLQGVQLLGLLSGTALLAPAGHGRGRPRGPSQQGRDEAPGTDERRLRERGGGGWR